VEVRAIEGLKFHYKQGRLDLRKTIGAGLKLWRTLESRLGPLLEQMERERPDLVISDFEPLVARAARRLGVPVLSLDHQHFLLAYDLHSLSWKLQLMARSMRLAVWAFGIGQQKTVVSAFYSPSLKRGYEDVVQVGPLLRPALRDVQPTVGDYVVSYLRRSTPPRVIDLLEALSVPVRVFGLGESPPRGQVEFHPVDEQAFTRSLAGANAVVAAAGNQLLGESLYLGKPFFALPEEKHFEQCINAHFLRQLGGGDWCAIERVQQRDLERFMVEREAYRAKLAGRQDEFDGTPAAVAAIESMLS
jgi:uncharacterized protein (TIGR00661 family)